MHIGPPILSPHRFVVLAVLLVSAAAASAQDAAKTPPPPLRIADVRVGFRAYDPNRTYSKPSMWVPIQVRLQVGNDKIEEAVMTLETSDNEDTPTIVTVPIQPFLNADEKRTIRSMFLPGNFNSDLKVKIKTRDRTYEKDVSYLDMSRVESSMRLFLTLGARFPDLNQALLKLKTEEIEGEKRPQQADQPNNPPAAGVDENFDVRDTSPRFAAYETDAKALPDTYHAYEGIDLIILSTENKEFLNSLMEQNDLNRLRALTQWVRRGGHVVISVHWKNQTETARLLAHPVWQPPVPVQLPAAPDPSRDPQRLVCVEEWTGARNNKAFMSPSGTIPIALLQKPGAPRADWDVQAYQFDRSGEPVPVIARMPYGLGSITLLAFSVDPGSPFSKWDGRVEFWMNLVKTLSPHLPQGEAWAQGKQFRQTTDLINNLHKELDVFDVKIVPFGWVALFILVYILIVGPVDYLVLKYVFKRLEWTWITFPIVVFAVSFAAYFTAYAIKGKELRINQVDIVDIDMRTDLDRNQQPVRAYVYGQTFFTLLSPRLQNYTIGLEPNPLFWGQKDGKDTQSADMVTWMPKGGNAWGGSENRGAQMLFRRPYNIGDPGDQAAGLVGVPISVWASKAFQADWQATPAKLPFDVHLSYHAERNEAILSGKLTNHLPVDLEDVWLWYNGKMYAVADELKSTATMDRIALPQKSKPRSAGNWFEQEDVCDTQVKRRFDKGTVYNPSSVIKQAFTFDKTPGGNTDHDQWLRRLDQSWRMKEDVVRDRDTRVRDGILYARVRFRSGSAPDLCADEKNPLPTRIWLGKLPGQHTAKNAHPLPAGNLNQDTYIRVLIPIRPESG